MGQSFTCLHCHLVFSTKSRLPQITPDFRQRLYDYIGGIIKGEKGRLVAAGGTVDHIHLLVSLHQQTAVADILRDIKANSSKWVHEAFADKSTFAWQSGYGAFSVSCSNLEQVVDYIQRQEAHHRTLSFQEEFIAFLDRHGVAYDERYVWE